MIKVLKKANYPTYAEEGQTNPIRWTILSKNPDGSFTQESNVIRCKDFFNDYVYSYNTGKFFSIYSFSPNGYNMPKKGEPCYMEITGLTPSFVNNLDIFNEYLDKEGLPIVKSIKSEKGLVIEIDPFYLQNTHHISLLSLAIRIINCDKELKTWEDIKAYRPTEYGDAGKWDKVVKKGTFFKIPDHLKKYVWFVNKDYNSETNSASYNLSSLVHNNGVLSWSNNW
jgi:hypothetical protein